MKQPAGSLEISLRWRDDPDAHHDGLEDHPGDLALVALQRPLEGFEVAEGHDDGEVRELLRKEGADRDASGALGRPGFGAPGVYRHLHRVVVPVIAAFDLDDLPALGELAHEVDGVERRL